MALEAQKVIPVVVVVLEQEQQMVEMEQRMGGLLKEVAPQE